MSVETSVVFAVLILSSIVTFSFVFRRIITYSIQMWRKKLIPVSEILDRLFILILFISLILNFSLFFFNQMFSMVNINYFDELFVQSWMKIIVNNPVLTSLFFGCVIAIIYSIDSCDSYLVQSESERKSIGIMWAHSAYNAYYEVLFSEWTQHTNDYLRAGERLDSMKLILICPLSCNIDKALNERCDKIHVKGSLTDIECDQGANINRRYKMPVYGVKNEKNVFYLIAQFTSSLGTLFQVKDCMPFHVWLYHRDSFITTLKTLLKDYPCTILEFDDQGESSQESLDLFLIRRLNLRSELNLDNT